MEERLWEKVDRAGKHWLWTRGSAQNVNVDGRPVGANRVAWALEVGPIPPGGRLIRTCLEGRCIHPAHHELVLARGGHALGCRATARRRRIEALSAEEHQRLVDYHLVLRCDPCSYCGAPMETVDHIDAFSRGGAVDWTNLTASCAACNNSKFTSSLLIWLWRKAVI